MGLEAATLSSISAGIAGVSAVAGLVQGQAAASAQKKAQAAQSRLQQMEAHKARVQAVREARIKRAQLLSESTMGESTSGVAGGASSISSQLGANMGFQNIKEDIGTEISNANQSALDASSSQQMFGTIFSVANRVTDWQRLNGGNTVNNYSQVTPKTDKWGFK